MTTAAIYVRCSTDEQNIDAQLAECRQLAAARGLEVIQVYKDEGVSGDAEARPALARMLADAHKGRFKVLIIWALDRISRRGIAEVAGIIAKLDKAKVGLVSVQESWADTSGPVRDLLVAVMSWVAQQERARLIERIRAGIAHARKHGTKKGRPIGRPAIPAHKIEHGLRLIDAGKPVAQAAKAAGCSPARLRQARAARRAGGAT